MRCGVLFGPERTGLENDDVALADTVITVPLNPDYCSLNLAQSVLLIAYEWFQAALPASPQAMTKGAAPVALKEDLVGFFQHLERELDDCGFFRVAEKRPTMIRNIRNMFDRADLTQQEVRNLHGIVHELVTYRKRKGEQECVTNPPVSKPPVFASRFSRCLRKARRLAPGRPAFSPRSDR